MEPQPGGARSCRRGGPGGACELGPVADVASMSLAIHSTTGTRYELSVSPDETVEGLRKRLSQRLKVPKERLALLHKDTRLSSGKLQEFGVGDGSKLTLVPTVEAGLMSQASRPEQSVMQALESLTETQVSDFLSGRSPLTLALRVGDHMMFVQLQLAAQHAPLQHRHVLAAAAAAAAATRGDPSMTTPMSSPCRPLSSTTRVPPVPTSPAPASSSPVTAGSFRSHSASTTCPEQMDCSPATSTRASPTSTPGSSPTSRSRKPGAIIESFVNHAPGVFSGTFSGTLHPNCQDSSGRPRRDIGTILQILNDLLSATRHYQGMPPSLTQLRCHAQCAPASPAADLTPKTTSCEKLAAASPASLSQARLGKPTGECPGCPAHPHYSRPFCVRLRAAGPPQTGESPAATQPALGEPGEKGSCVGGTKCPCTLPKGVCSHFLLTPLGHLLQVASGSFVNGLIRLRREPSFPPTQPPMSPNVFLPCKSAVAQTSDATVSGGPPSPGREGETKALA